MAGPITTEVIPSPAAPPVFPVVLFTPTPRGGEACVGILHGADRNDHTRKAYLNATRFAAGARRTKSANSSTCIPFTRASTCRGSARSGSGAEAGYSLSGRQAADHMTQSRTAKIDR
jgi:hypothetical protein